MYVLICGYCNLEVKGIGLVYWIGGSEEVYWSYNMYLVNLLIYFCNLWYWVFFSKCVCGIF